MMHEALPSKGSKSNGAQVIWDTTSLLHFAKGMSYAYTHERDGREERQDKRDISDMWFFFLHDHENRFTAQHPAVCTTFSVRTLPEATLSRPYIIGLAKTGGDKGKGYL